MRKDYYIIARDRYLNQLIECIGTSKIKIVTGLRRSGKSYLLNTIFTNYLLSKGVDKSHIIFIELDDEKNEYLLEKWMLREYIENIASDDNAQYYIILDEMENGNINKMKLILLRENMISNIIYRLLIKCQKMVMRKMNMNHYGVFQDHSKNY